MAILYSNWHDKNIKGAEIAANDLAVTNGRLVSIKSGYADLTVTWDTIVGISRQDKTFDSDNITVKKAKLTYIWLDMNMEFKSTVVWGTIAQANVGTTYDIDANGDVDISLTTPSQVKLVKVINGTLGVFSRAK